MSKLPKDILGIELAGLLKKYGYEITRQAGNHIRLVSRHAKKTTTSLYPITIP